MTKLFLLVSALAISISSYAADNTQIPIANFSGGQLENWQTKSFKGKTQYKFTQLDNVSVLKAESNKSASGLFKEQRIDLQKTPYLNWRWRIENRLGPLNEQSKVGDDYAARVYIVVSGGFAFWNTKAINYVWAGNSEKGKIWPNAFVGKSAMMVAVRASSDDLGRWYTEKRNILQDLKQLYGESIRYIDAVAIMTDTDNASGKATAYYGDISFTAN